MTRKACPDSPVFSELQALMKQSNNEPCAVSIPETLEGIAIAIVKHKGQMAEKCWIIGKLLIAAKEKLTGHGEWLPWLAGNVDIPDWQAERYMKLAREYPNSTAPSILGLTKALELAKIPADKRDEFLREPHLVDGQEKTVIQMTTRELEKAIREWIEPKTEDSDDYQLISVPIQRGPEEDDTEDTLWNNENREKLFSELDAMQIQLQPILDYLKSMKLMGNPGERCTNKLLAIHKDIMSCLRLAGIKDV